MLKIIVDTREQNPYLFTGYPVSIAKGTLDTGDYSIPGHTDLVAIERKELTDLMGCLTYDRKRFIRELERLRGYPSAVLVVEARFDTILAGQYRSKMHPTAAVQSIVSIMQQYRLPIFFVPDRAAGERFTYDFLRHYAVHAMQRYKSIPYIPKNGVPAANDNQ